MSVLRPPQRRKTLLTASLQTYRRVRFPTVLRSPIGIAGVSIVAIWVIVALAAPLLAPDNPLAQNFPRLHSPSGTNLFGTDSVGRDVLSRVLYGSRVTLPVAVALVVVSLIVGSVLGAIAGFFGRVVDEVIMRIADLFFAFPGIILAMIVAASLGRGLLNAAVALVVVSWPAYARLARSLVLTARQNEYVVSGRLLGASAFTSLTRDILPNVAAQLLVLAMLDFGNAVLLLAGLSFLGLGVGPPTADWGAMVSDGVSEFSSWWIALFPGLAIFSLVVAFNLIGDSLRDALDPRTAGAITGAR